MPTTSKPLSFVPKNPYLTQDRNLDENHHRFNNLSASVGFRVLGCRSLDTEGTQGIVGTVTELSNTAEIQWDTGTEKETYSVGHHDQRQLFVLDNASIGIAHGGTTCEACEQCPIAGLRWKCLDCKESSVDLCTSCYMRDNHDRDHSFLRFDTSKKDGIPVERRSKTKKIQARGILLGTKVKRGPDWQYGDEDGGPGKFGTVTEITRWEENPTGAARVAWHSGSEGTYRLGYKGKVDLQCTNGGGGFYYIKHLPRLQPCQQTTPEAEGNLTDISGALREGHALRSHCDIPVSGTTHDTVTHTSQGPAADSQKPTVTDWEKRGQEAKASRNKLHKESINGNSKAVKMLLNSGEDVNQGDKFLLTPLHLAAWYGQESVVKLLLEGGANVNATDIFQKTPLQKAERHNHQSIIKILQKYGATPTYHQPSTLKSLSKMAFVTVDRHSGFNLLQAMVFEGNFDGVLAASIFLDDFVRELNFESTANNAKTFPSKTAHDMLSTLKKHDHGKIKRFCEETLEKIRTLTELHECVDNDDTEKAVELVLHHGLDVNSPAKGNRTPLLWASLRSSSAFVQTLINLGAETNARREDKCTPLILATDWNNYMAVHLLTKMGADTDAQQMEGKAALHFASCRSANITQCLIESGCNVNLQSNTGRTPLHLAVQNKQKYVVKMLLENNADVGKRDKQDRNDRVILVRGKDKGKPAWHFVEVKKALTGLFYKRVKSGSLDVADFGTVLASGWGTHPPDSEREQILKAHSENTVEIKDMTALHIACEIGDVAIVELLVEHGAVINALDADGFTPLQLAAIRGNMKVVKRLVERKADVNLTTADGKDAVDYAKMNEEVEIEEFLKSKKSLLKRFWNRLSRK